MEFHPLHFSLLLSNLDPLVLALAYAKMQTAILMGRFFALPLG